MKRLPTSQNSNERFYVDVCRAEDRIKQLAHFGRALLDRLPAHWHDDATVEFRDLIEEVEKGPIGPPRRVDSAMNAPSDTRLRALISGSGSAHASLREWRAMARELLALRAIAKAEGQP